MKKLMVAVMVMTVMVSGATNVYASTSYSVDTATESLAQLHHQHRLQLLTTRIMEQPVQQIPKQTLYQHRIQNLIQKQIQQLRLRLHQETKKIRILQSLREVILKKIEWNIYMYPLQVPQLML